MPDYTSTRTYANLKDGYNAGSANDAQSRDRIISRGNQALYEDCKGYNSKSSKGIDYERVSNVIDSSTDDLFNLYKNDVEFVNSFQEQVREDEKRYFEKKYSPSVYRYLIEKRTEYLTELDKQKRLALNPTCPDLSNNINDVSGNKCNNTNQLKELYNKISSFYPSINSTTTYRKIEYRDKEHQFLMTINSIINILYYVIFFVMILLLASSGQLKIKERYPIYILLLILPFLYPYVFNFFKNIFANMFSSKPTHGPKNAFVEMPPPNIDAFNI